MIRKHFKNAIVILALLCAILPLTGCTTTVNIPADPSPSADETPQAEEAVSKEDKKEEDKADDAEPTEDTYKEDAAEVFAEMSDWVFVFSSGAGGWDTTMTVKPDGTFTGLYHDSEMSSTGPGYPNGTIYECDFSGKFSDYVRSAGPLMHSLSIESIKYGKEPDTEEIRDNILYKYTTPYGIEGLEKVTDYAPLVFLEAGAVTSVLNEEEMNWISTTHFGTYVGEDWDYVEDKPEELPYAVLLNTEDDLAFYTESVPGKNKTFLVNKAKLPGLHNTECTVNDDGTYYCVDENDDSSFRVISTCFKASGIYDTFTAPEKLVNDSVKQIFKDRAPDPEDIRITSPKDASEMSYPLMAVCGYHTDYAYWYPEKDSNGPCVEGRLLVMNGYETDQSFIYAYFIETKGSDERYPDEAFAGNYISSLTLTGKRDEISSAGTGDGAVRSILTVMKTPEGDNVSAKELIWVSQSDKDLIKKYHLEDADFNDDYETVSPDDTFHDHRLAEGMETPFYIVYPEDKIHSYRTAYDLKEVMGEPSDETSKLMQLYLNKQDEVVYGYEVYTP